jgi:hypothetical protein
VASQTAEETQNTIGDIRRTWQPSTPLPPKTSDTPVSQATNGSTASLPNPVDIADDPES